MDPTGYNTQHHTRLRHCDAQYDNLSMQLYSCGCAGQHTAFGLADESPPALSLAPQVSLALYFCSMHEYA